MPRVDTNYDGGGAVTTRMDLRGVDIGPPPDFWQDYGEVTRRIKAPTRSAFNQGEALAPARQERPVAPRARYDPYSGMVPTSRSFARPAMSPQGVLGHYVNPLDVPIELQGQVATGFFTDDAASNYLYSPTVNPIRYGQRK